MTFDEWYEKSPTAQACARDAIVRIALEHAWKAGRESMRADALEAIKGGACSCCNCLDWMEAVK